MSAAYKIVDHVYDAVVVGAGGEPLVPPMMRAAMRRSQPAYPADASSVTHQPAFTNIGTQIAAVTRTETTKVRMAPSRLRPSS